MPRRTSRPSRTGRPRYGRVSQWQRGPRGGSPRGRELPGTRRRPPRRAPGAGPAWWGSARQAAQPGRGRPEERRSGEASRRSPRCNIDRTEDIARLRSQAVEVAARSAEPAREEALEHSGGAAPQGRIDAAGPQRRVDLGRAELPAAQVEAVPEVVLVGARRLVGRGRSRERAPRPGERRVAPLPRGVLPENTDGDDSREEEERRTSDESQEGTGEHLERKSGVEGKSGVA